jgi:Abortive infection alpha
MTDQGAIIPISDEQAKFGQEALKLLRDLGGLLRETFGTVPEDLVAYFGGDWLKVRRAENAARLFREAKARLDARNARPEPPSISLLVPLVVAAADEDRDELRDIWARLLAAAADPERGKSFRAQFIEAAKQMDALDAAVMQSASIAGGVSGQIQERMAKELKVRRDEVSVSLDNLARLKLMDRPHTQYHASAFGREFLVAIAD